MKAFGRLDILVNNAAFQVHTARLANLSAEHFDETLKTNLYGYFFMAKAAAAEMRPGAAIINTGSVNGDSGKRRTFGLLDDEGRDSCVYALFGDAPCTEGDSGKRSRPGPP